MERTRQRSPSSLPAQCFTPSWLACRWFRTLRRRPCRSPRTWTRRRSGGPAARDVGVYKRVRSVDWRACLAEERIAGAPASLPCSAAHTMQGSSGSPVQNSVCSPAAPPCAPRRCCCAWPAHAAGSQSGARQSSLQRAARGGMAIGGCRGSQAGTVEYIGQANQPGRWCKGA